MREVIPQTIISLVGDMISNRETHASLNSLFLYAGAPGEPPEGNKQVKAISWIQRVNQDLTVNPLEVLGKLLEKYMEEILDDNKSWEKDRIVENKKIMAAMEKYGLHYLQGGLVVTGAHTPSKSLEDYIKENNLEYFDFEFNRALQNVDTIPREAISAASNMLETICKVYIEVNKLEMPAKQDLRPVWNIVKKNLGFDASKVEDGDLQKILTGLFSIVEGIGELRTHASSAHGMGKTVYRIEPRHARLAIHSAHTASLFLLETWKKRKTSF
jgi:uncharacterized protein YecA (UPF0149 family)